MRHNLLSFGRTRVPQLSVIEGERYIRNRVLKLSCVSPFINRLVVEWGGVLFNIVFFVSFQVL